MQIQRKKTRKIQVGNVSIGGKSPISVQSMTNTFTKDVKSTVSQIKRLEEVGCEIVRVAVPDEDSANAISEIKKNILIPIIADIHFDYRLAIASIKSGADALRINPGNIGSKKNIKAVIDCAKDNNIPIRIGVNAGSLEKNLLEKYKGATPEAMVESALKNLDLVYSYGFDNVKISLKASDVLKTIFAYRLFSEKSNVPLHVGITEAGGLYPGIVKSSIGIGLLLFEGIGDTIRVSLSKDPVEEVRVGYEVLKALGLRQRGPEIISCPTCGRCNIDLFTILEKTEKALIKTLTPIKIAIMGCVVNGPGEAKEADIGICGGNGIGILFKKGKVIKKFNEDNLVEVLLDEVDKAEKIYRKKNDKKQ